MVELALLNFAGDNPKINIKNHGINIDNPGSGYIPQAVSRFISGDSKEDIFILNLMVVNYIDWFIINNYNGKFEIYKNIALYAVSGLRKLQHTYKSGIVILALQYYIVLIMKAISDMEVTRNKKHDKPLNVSVSVNSLNDTIVIDNDAEFMPQFSASGIYNLPPISANDYDHYGYEEIKSIDVEKNIKNRDDSPFINKNTITDTESLKLWMLPIEEVKSIVDSNKIKEIWSSDDVDHLYKILSDCFTQDNAYHFSPKFDAFVEAQIQALMLVLKNKDTSFNRIIKNSYGGK
jgi:hypothetical protein